MRWPLATVNIRPFQSMSHSSRHYWLTRFIYNIIILVLCTINCAVYVQCFHTHFPSTFLKFHSYLYVYTYVEIFCLVLSSSRFILLLTTPPSPHTHRSPPPHSCCPSSPHCVNCSLPEWTTSIVMLVLSFMVPEWVTLLVYWQPHPLMLGPLDL